ncbi:uncharacterized protein LOC124161184 isoform X1 [Ischnura elegans]|uniref:uncharacterized protein LOC124161184 isoform X1 n=1 Tax=Ischnura elegans TaxID=197161 RepID=UPI001ED8BB83|nr:uncharacterized protein LOC124161184 isoform X1 [Ischnura elegans]XP_046393387.1 uncharacterized protein LOC124161184 isoform X1 [Ischnura elegans]XP_046393397.1 uncharacterized protein LOC124161184 isoform X1 [Ischnura elegans]XP_046393404.1 uncharacterized protein LOC124161184 isoform X1 [Ischnura elegans]
MPVGGRVAGKIGIISTIRNSEHFFPSREYNGERQESVGRSLGYPKFLRIQNHTGINEEIIWVSIGMGITIALLITIALCYILREKCRSSRRPHEYYITA